MEKEQTSTESRPTRISCIIWGSPLLYVTKDGLQIPCKSCSKSGVKAKHFFSRKQLEQMWADMESQATSGVSISIPLIPSP